MLNSAESVEALEDYRKLYTFGPPGWGNAFFAEINTAIAQGQVAMGMNYFAFFPSLLNEATNPQRQEYGLLREPARARVATTSPLSAARASRWSPTARTRKRR